MEGKKNILLHRFIMNPPENMQIDHINNSGLDCRKENLRIVTNHQNSMNRKIGTNSFSQFKGVIYWNSQHKDKRVKRWIAQIKLDYKLKRLGYFHTEIEAAQRYNQEATKLYGKYAKLNVI